MPAKDYRELRVYQLAFETALRVFEISKRFPPDERYSLTDQIRRSSRAVCSNIAEAWPLRERRYPASFVSKLSDSDSESAETTVWLDFCKAFGYITEQDRAELTDHYDHICSQLAIMMAEPEKWCPPNSKRKA